MSAADERSVLQVAELCWCNRSSLVEDLRHFPARATAVISKPLLSKQSSSTAIGALASKAEKRARMWKAKGRAALRPRVKCSLHWACCCRGSPWPALLSCLCHFLPLALIARRCTVTAPTAWGGRGLSPGPVSGS